MSAPFRKTGFLRSDPTGCDGLRSAFRLSRMEPCRIRRISVDFVMSPWMCKSIHDQGDRLSRVMFPSGGIRN